MTVPTLHNHEFRILLSDWLPIWEAAVLPYVPLEQVGSATVREWVDAVEGVWSSNVQIAMAAAAQTPDGYMVRWDCCCAEDLKWAMDKQQPGYRYPHTADDCRFFSILEDCSAIYGEEKQIPLWRRPWIDATDVDGWPLEFRVFYLGGDLQGVSSYYPQRPLPDHYQEEAQEVAALSGRLAEQGPRDFTADWLYSADDGAPLLIECGPPHLPVGGGAHPCCFKSGEVCGIALTDRNSPRRGLFDEDG
jgi:hypothetical protein